MSKYMLILTINLRVFLSCPRENGNESIRKYSKLVMSPYIIPGGGGHESF